MNHHGNTLTPQPSTPRRRVSKKTLGFLTAAAVTAGSIGSVTLMTTPSAADSPTPAVISVEPDSGESVIMPAPIDEVPNIAAEVPEEVYDWSGDDCPACGMG